MEKQNDCYKLLKEILSCGIGICSWSFEGLDGTPTKTALRGIIQWSKDLPELTKKLKTCVLNEERDEQNPEQDSE